MLNEELLQVAVADGVNRGDDYVLHLSALGELVKGVFVDQVHPVLPLVLLRVVYVVVDESAVEGAGEDLLLEFHLHCVELAVADLLELLVEGAAELGVNRDTQRPDR